MSATPPWSISVDAKEMVTYWEGDHGFIFDCAWGVDPGILFVPPENLWDRVVPAWLVGRRAEIVDRLKERSGHVVKDDDNEYRDIAWRLRSR